MFGKTKSKNTLAQRAKHCDTVVPFLPGSPPQEVIRAYGGDRASGFPPFFFLLQ